MFLSKQSDQTLNKKAITDIMECIPCIVDQKGNEELESQVTEEEIKNALFLMNKDKSPGPDRYQTNFFQHNWEIVVKDVIQAVKEFFRKGKLLKQWNTTFVALIPKDLKDYRPINLCNVVYKILTKILAERLKHLLWYIISPEQDGFVQGR